jgi:hypothetical protein
VGFVVDKVALGQVFSRVLRFSPVNFIPPVLHYLEKLKKTDHVSLHLHHKGCTISLKAAVRPWFILRGLSPKKKKKKKKKECVISYDAMNS